MPAKTPDKHWYYPSSLIGCGLSIDNLSSDELACLRSEVTCPRCVERINADKTTCEACRFGPKTERSHVCDPGLVYVVKNWPYQVHEINLVLCHALRSRCLNAAPS